MMSSGKSEKKKKNSADLSDEDRKDEDDYEITDDQRQAMMELETQKAEMVYPDEEPPEYDVTERVKQLNEELEKEADPKDRETKVGFKENPVDLVVPPPSFSDDEADSVRDSGRESGGAGVSDKRKNFVSHQKSGSDDDDRDEAGDEHHLVERDGKFEYVSKDDVTAREQRRANKPRAHAASGTDDDRAHQTTRAQSAEYSRSRYGLSPEQKKLIAERKKAEDNQRREDDKRLKEEEEERSRENEKAFEMWLKKKREEQKDQNNRGRTAKEEEDERRDSEKAFAEWVKHKQKAKQQEKDLEAQRMAEAQNGYFVRSRAECDKAFKQWLKKKIAEKQNQLSSQRSRQYALSASRSRKSQALARAIQYSQTFRYVDYYGYRM